MTRYLFAVGPVQRLDRQGVRLVDRLADPHRWRQRHLRYLFRITTVGQLGINPSSNLAWPFVWFFDWAFDTSFILYGTLFMMSGAYTLSRNAHVRGDMLYREWSVRTQAIVDLICYLTFFLPGSWRWCTPAGSSPRCLGCTTSARWPRRAAR